MFKKLFLAAFIASIVGFGGVPEAQAATTVLQPPSAQTLAALEVRVQSAQMELIKQLMAQVTVLQEQLTKLLAAQSSVPVTSIGKIVVDLKIDGSDGPLILKPGYAKFTWKTNAESCIASGDVDYWSGEKAASGEARVWTGNEKYGITTYTLECSGTNVNSEGDSVTIMFDYGTQPVSMLELTSPSGGETYGTDIPELNIKYRSKGLKGEDVIAYLHKSDKHYSNYQRSKTVTVSSDGGNIVMGMQKGGAQTPGKYKVTICVLVPGKDFCRESGSFELVGEAGEPYVTDSFVGKSIAGVGVYYEYSYTIHNMRDGLTFWAEPDVYCDDTYIAPIKRDCSKSKIFFAWGEGGVKGDGGKMNPYVKGGASYQLPTSLDKSFITTSGVAHEFFPNPDGVDIRFVLRDERGRELWSKVHQFGFKG